MSTTLHAQLRFAILDYPTWISISFGALATDIQFV